MHSLVLWALPFLRGLCPFSSHSLLVLSQVARNSGLYRSLLLVRHGDAFTTASVGNN